MAKKNIKAVCESIAQNSQGGIVRFVVAAPAAEQPKPQPGQPRQLKAKTVVQVMFAAAADAAAYEHGKEYSITIEG